MYMRMLVESTDVSSDGDYGITLAALDIKDAFLQVAQEKLVGVSLYNQQYIIKGNLPGLRLGAKSWYWFFRNYVSEVLQCEWSVEQPGVQNGQGCRCHRISRSRIP